MKEGTSNTNPEQSRFQGLKSQNSWTICYKVSLTPWKCNIWGTDTTKMRRNRYSLIIAKEPVACWTWEFFFLEAFSRSCNVFQNCLKRVFETLSDPSAKYLDKLQWRIQDFPEEGAPTLRGAPTYDFAKFSQKLHEIEEFGPPGGAASKILLCRSATELGYIYL